MNHLALVTSLKVSGNFPTIAGNFPKFHSGMLSTGYIMLRSLLHGYLCFGFVYANVSGDHSICSAAVNIMLRSWIGSFGCGQPSAQVSPSTCFRYSDEQTDTCLTLISYLLQQ
jgi:hypothetical protein